ncbi:MAG: trypsin-like peptidase domain-containing protein [FCB group bacterium]|jgi:serine protease Do
MFRILGLIFSLLFIYNSSYAVNPGSTDSLKNHDKIITNDVSDNAVNSSRQNAITRAVAICSPAIVGINVTELHKVEYADPFDNFFDDPFFRYYQRYFGRYRGTNNYREYAVQSLGSGFIISPDGYILTNHHVAGNASKIIITMTDGKKYDAEIIGADKASDVALLKINGNDFPFLKFANSDDIITGEWAIAFGNPFGLFDINAKPTVTVGVVSNKGIDFTQEDRVYRGMIQTDAAISSGNSGGPLVNASGDVIGMNTVIFSTALSQRGAGSIGIGFAIPVNRISKIVELFKNNKSINRNFVTGMEVRQIDEQIASYLKSNLKEGVVVFAVNRNSPAEEAGIEPGDIILEINNKPILRIDDYNIIVLDGIVGDKLDFTLLRDDKRISKTLTLKPIKR